LYERSVERFDELPTFCFQGPGFRNLNDLVLIFSCFARDSLGALRWRKLRQLAPSAMRHSELLTGLRNPG
jgi:hypothetical protein